LKITVVINSKKRKWSQKIP